MPGGATTEKVRVVNPDVLAWARVSAGYSVSEVARSVGTSEASVSAWERGTDWPRYRQLERLANKVKRPVAVFFLPAVPDEPSPPADFRTLPRRPQGEYTAKTRLAIRQARNLLADARELLDTAENPLRLSLPAFSMSDDPEKVAPQVRSLLGVSFEEQCACRDDYKALDLWRDVVFDRGVVAATFSFPLDDARAFSLVWHDLGGIGLNSRDAPYARIFSLLHELYHLCLGLPGVSGGDPRRVSGPQDRANAVERHCNRFAAALLLPASEKPVVEALAELRASPIPSVGARLARRLKVSKYAILGRLLDLGFVSDDRFWSLIEQWKSAEPQVRPKSGGGNTVLNQVSGLGKRFTAFVLDALEAGDLSSYEASTILGLNPRDFDEARRRAGGGLYAR